MFVFSMSSERVDIAIVGAGVIGLAIARELGRHPVYGKRSILLLDQERGFGQHTSSRNSEVIHAGIYYPGDSLKARLCVRGKALLYDYCQRYDIAHRACGKLIVAQSGEEAELTVLQQKAEANGVMDLEQLDQRQLATLEPDVRASAALLSPSTGILDSHHFMQSLLHNAEQCGVQFAPLTTVTKLHRRGDEIEVSTQSSDGRESRPFSFRCGSLINCAGLWASNVAAMLDPEDSNDENFPPVTHWCKGDYFSYQGPARFQRLIYPLPEPGTRGLGVHATLDLANQIRFGPDSNFQSTLDYEVDADKAAHFAAEISRYLPTIDAGQLQPSYAGIRPKLAGPGQPAADFVIVGANGTRSDSVLHLLGIESPGLTASLALAEEVCERLLVN